MQTDNTSIVELTREIRALVRVLDMHGEKLLASYFPLMGLTAQSGSDIIAVRQDSSYADDPYAAQYIIHGAALGRTMLHFSATSEGGQLVTSHHKEIQVFPPLRLNPRNITIIVGAAFQVTVLQRVVKTCHSF